MLVTKHVLPTGSNKIKEIIKVLFGVVLILIATTTFCVSTANAQETLVKLETKSELFDHMDGFMNPGDSLPFFQDFHGSLMGDFVNRTTNVGGKVTINSSQGAGGCNNITIPIAAGNEALQHFNCTTSGGLVTISNAGPAAVAYNIYFGF